MEFSLPALKYLNLEKIQLNLNIFDGLYGDIVDRVERAVSKIQKWTSSLSYNPLDKIVDILSNIGTHLTPITDHFQRIQEKVLALPGVARAKVEEGIDQVLAFFDNAVKGLIEFQRGALQWLTDKVQSAFDDVGQAVQLVVDSLAWLFKAPLRAIQALGNAVSAVVKAAAKIYLAVKQFFRKIMSFFLGLPSWLDFPNISLNILSLEDVHDVLISLMETVDETARAAIQETIDAIKYVVGTKVVDGGSAWHKHMWRILNVYGSTLPSKNPTVWQGVFLYNLLQS